MSGSFLVPSGAPDVPRPKSSYGRYATVRAISSSVVSPESTLSMPSSRSVLMPSLRATRADLGSGRLARRQPPDGLAHDMTS